MRKMYKDNIKFFIIIIKYKKFYIVMLYKNNFK